MQRRVGHWFLIFALITSGGFPWHSSSSGTCQTEVGGNADPGPLETIHSAQVVFEVPSRDNLLSKPHPGTLGEDKVWIVTLRG